MCCTRSRSSGSKRLRTFMFSFATWPACLCPAALAILDPGSGVQICKRRGKVQDPKSGSNVESSFCQTMPPNIVAVTRRVQCHVCRDSMYCSATFILLTALTSPGLVKWGGKIQNNATCCTLHTLVCSVFYLASYQVSAILESTTRSILRGLSSSLKGYCMQLMTSCWASAAVSLGPSRITSS